jgi:hypothetical protein
VGTAHSTYYSQITFNILATSTVSQILTADDAVMKSARIPLSVHAKSDGVQCVYSTLRMQHVVCDILIGFPHASDSMNCNLNVSEHQ